MVVPISLLIIHDLREFICIKLYLQTKKLIMWETNVLRSKYRGLATIIEINVNNKFQVHTKKIIYTEKK